MRLFRSSEILGIARETLQFALEASEETHPKEYMGLLRAEDARTFDLDRRGQVITDVLIIPGTTSDSSSATVRSNMIPNDLKAVGSVHSHPNGVLRPSQADLATFHKGNVHIIIGAPYGRSDWRVFNSAGEPRSLEVLDVALPEGQFFDFTQADIDAELGIDGADDHGSTDDRRFDDGGQR